MKFTSTLIVVTDMEKSVEFYTQVLGLKVILDFGENKTLTGGLSLQTHDTFLGFIENQPIKYQGNNFEICFEEDDFDGFIQKLQTFDLDYVHPPKEHSWGQRVVRFFDPDKHVIEVGENIKTVVNRLIDQGMTPEQVATRMDVPLSFVTNCIK